MNKLIKVVLLTLIGGLASAAQAGVIFVGSWDVYNDLAPHWSEDYPDNQLAYTAQEAAALLFGGNASEYVISTVDDQVANIDYQAWYDVIGFGGVIFAQDYFNKYLDLYYGPVDSYVPSSPTNAASAFIRDNLDGDGAINFAFRIVDDGETSVPEPSLMALLLAGMGGLFLRRRRA